MNLQEAIAYMTPHPTNHGVISLRADKAREAMDVITGQFTPVAERHRERFAHLFPEGRPVMPAGYAAPLVNPFVAEL